MFFKLNCRCYSRISYEEEVNSHSKSRSTDKLLADLKELIIIYQENLHDAQELQMRAHNKVFSLNAMLLVIKYSSIANKLRPNLIRSLEKSFLDHSESYILLGSKFINESFLESGKFMVFFFFMCHCWSRTQLGREDEQKSQTSGVGQN